MGDNATMVALIAVGAVWFVGAVLYDAWRNRERACLRCRGARWVYRVTLLGFLVRGECRRCGGYGWYQRRLSRLFGWNRSTHCRW